MRRREVEAIPTENEQITRFMFSGNACGERLRIARALQSPPLSQAELAEFVQARGMKMTPLIISRIETNQRHVCDAELYMLAKVLNVSMAWLCGEAELFDMKPHP